MSVATPPCEIMMPTLTILYRTEAERLAYERAEPASSTDHEQRELPGPSEFFTPLCDVR
jgi:hypothetical protein